MLHMIKDFNRLMEVQIFQDLLDRPRYTKSTAERMQKDCSRLWIRYRKKTCKTAVKTGLFLGSLLLYDCEREEEAESVLRETMQILEKRRQTGWNSEQTARVACMLAQSCTGQGRQQEAESYVQQTLEHIGDCHREVAGRLYGQLALIWEQLGQQEKAMEAAYRALGVVECDLDAKSVVESEKTAYRSMRWASRELQKASRSPTSEKMALIQLCKAYNSVGDGVRAVELARRARSNDWGYRPQTGALLVEACLTWAENGGELPEDWVDQALRLLDGVDFSKWRGPSPSALRQKLYLYKGDRANAEKQVRQEIYDCSNLPADDPDAISQLESVAEFYDQVGQYRCACSYAREALRRRKKTCSPVDMLSSLWNVARMSLRAEGRPDTEATGLLMTALEQAPDRVVWLPQEDLRRGYLRKMKTQREFCCQAALCCPEEIPTERLYEFILQTHNLDGQISYTQSRFFREVEDADLRWAREKVEQLQRKRDCAIKEGTGSEDDLCWLEQDVERAQMQLLNRMKDVHLPPVGNRVSLEEVREAMAPDEVILEYVRLLWTEDLRTYTGSAGSEGKNHYVGFCVTRDDIRVLDLGTAEAIDGEIGALLRAIAAEENCSGSLEKLYCMLAEPFAELLEGKRGLFVVPDADLYKLPFELLTDGEGRSLEKRFDSVRYLSSGREVLRRREEALRAENGIALIADPAYDLEDGGQPGPEDSHARSADVEALLRGSSIAALPFTRVEAEEIAPLFGEHARLFTGTQATKRVLEQEQPAEILHISTHGFAYETRKAPQTDGSLVGRGRQLQQLEDPMLRCGLLFAGAGNWIRGERLSETYGDGVLTGSDLLAMDLSRYRLLILSACQTGLGETQSGAGIKGLRSAFELAGVGSMLCTLWEVDDFASAILMRKFYEELLANQEEGPAQALARAKEFIRTVSGMELVEHGWQKHIMKLYELDYRTVSGENYAAWLLKSKHPFAHPRFWAGYIIQG